MACGSAASSAVGEAGVAAAAAILEGFASVVPGDVDDVDLDADAGARPAAGGCAGAGATAFARGDAVESSAGALRPARGCVGPGRPGLCRVKKSPSPRPTTSATTA